MECLRCAVGVSVVTIADGAVTREFHSYESRAEDETAAECAEGRW